MSGIAYRPPSENLAIFDPSVFLSQDQPLTYDIIANNFLQFPNGQGTETIPSLIVPGTSTLGVTNASTLNLSQTLNIANGLNTSTIDMDGSDNLIFDNNVNSGGIVFKSNNSAGSEQTILSLSGNTGTTTGLPITASSIGRAITATSTSASSSTSAVGVTATASRASFEGKSNSPFAASTRSIIMGVTGDVGFNAINSTNDAFVIGVNSTGNEGSLTLTTYSSTRLGVRINANSGTGSVNSVEVAGALIQLNATTAGGLTSTTTQPASNDSSTKIPTTAWVQSALLANPAIIPYYQVTAFFRNLAYGRAANIYFNFSGVAWGLNEFFTVSFRYEVNSVLTASVSTQPTTDFTVINGSVDIYPYRCPVNVATDTAYGIGQAGTTPSNFPQFNNNIYKPSTASYSSAFDLGTNDATYYPYGRYFWVSNYSIAQQGTQYSQTSPTNGLLPLQPYVPTGSVGQQRFGFALWNYNTTSTYTQYNNLSLQLTNRGSHPITITGDYLVFGDATVNTSGF